MKCVLLDVDGVVVIRHGYFSERFSKEHQVSIDKITPFFQNEFQRCILGQADLKTELPRYLVKWGWTGSLEEFLKYWFESERQTDQRVLDVAVKLRERGIKCYLVSDNEKYRAEYLMNEVGLKNYFDEAFFSYKLGVEKSQPEFFEKVLKQLPAAAGEVIYWDDDGKNVEVAKVFGIDARFYSDPDEFEESAASLMIAGKVGN